MIKSYLLVVMLVVRLVAALELRLGLVVISVFIVRRIMRRMFLLALGDLAIRLVVAIMLSKLLLAALAGADNLRLRALGRGGSGSRGRLRLITASLTVVIIARLAVFDNAVEAVAIAMAHSVGSVLMITGEALAGAWLVVAALCPFDFGGFRGFGDFAGLSKH